MSMSMRPRHYAATIVVALIALMVLPALSLAATYYVPGNYSTIGAAIANASAGDTITVDSGTYHENLLIGKALTLVGRDSGQGLPLIDAASGTGIDISADNVIIQGFRVANASKGIYIHDCSRAMITGSAIIDNNYGIVLTGCVGCNIMNNTVTGNHNNGINIGDSSGNSVYMNKVSGDLYGITLTGSSVSNVIYMNTLQGNTGANGLGNGQLNYWNSTVPITYGYGGKQFSSFLGNYWDNLAGTDANKDGIIDTSMILAVNNGDYNPMAQALPDNPSANFTADSTSGPAPMPVQFTDASEGYPVSWHWDFGDGGTSDIQDPAHVYQNNGQYTVSLAIKNVHGDGHLIRSNYIAVGAASPTAQSTANPTFTVTPAPWPTATPTPAPTIKPTGTAMPTPTAKPSPGMGPGSALVAGMIAYVLLANRKDR